MYAVIRVSSQYLGGCLLCWPLRSSAPHLLSVPHQGTGVIRRSRQGTHAAVSAARADALAILARSSRARMSQTASTGRSGQTGGASVAARRAGAAHHVAPGHSEDAGPQTCGLARPSPNETAIDDARREV